MKTRSIITLAALLMAATGLYAQQETVDTRKELGQADSLQAVHEKQERKAEQVREDEARLAGVTYDQKQTKAKAKEARRVEKEANAAARESRYALRAEKKAQKARKDADTQSKKAAKARVKSDNN